MTASNDGYPGITRRVPSLVAAEHLRSRTNGDPQGNLERKGQSVGRRERRRGKIDASPKSALAPSCHRRKLLLARGNIAKRVERESECTWAWSTDHHVGRGCWECQGCVERSVDSLVLRKGHMIGHPLSGVFDFSRDPIGDAVLCVCLRVSCVYIGGVLQCSSCSGYEDLSGEQTLGSSGCPRTQGERLRARVFGGVACCVVSRSLVLAGRSECAVRGEARSGQGVPPRIRPPVSPPPSQAGGGVLS